LYFGNNLRIAKPFAGDAGAAFMWVRGVAFGVHGVYKF